jgi:hypothetical protein
VRACVCARVRVRVVRVPPAMGARDSVYDFSAYRSGKFDLADIGPRRQPLHSTSMGVNSISPARLHVRPAWTFTSVRADELDEIKRNTHPRNITARFCTQVPPPASTSTWGRGIITRRAAWLVSLIPPAGFHATRAHHPTGVWRSVRVDEHTKSIGPAHPRRLLDGNGEWATGSPPCITTVTDAGRWRSKGQQTKR